MLIQTHAELKTFCERAHGARAVAIDTEFMSEGRYYPAPCTIQIAAGTQVAVIDLLSVDDLVPLQRVLLDPNATTVLHSGRTDLEILWRMLGRAVPRVFDTQIAASLLGYGDQVSLMALLKAVLGVQIEKGYTFTDWMRRPLTPEQVEYALNDVRHLLPLYEFLSEALQRKGRLPWADEEFAALANVEQFLLRDERECYKRLSSVNTLYQAGLNVVQELAAWRELKARELNLPARRIVSDPVLIELARRPCKTVRDLARVRGLNSGQIERYGTEIIRAMELGARNQADSIEFEEPFPSSLEATVDFLSLSMRSLAQEQSISTAVLGNRAGLRQLVKSGSDAQVPLLRGWRREAIGESLLKALSGHATVRVSPVTREVAVHWGEVPEPGG